MARYKLSADAIAILKPIFDKFHFDLSQINVHITDLVGAIGKTYGNDVNVDADYWFNPNRSNYYRLSLLAHEITHSVQYSVIGFARFYWRYPLEYLNVSPNTSVFKNYDSINLIRLQVPLNLETVASTDYSLDQMAQYVASKVPR